MARNIILLSDGTGNSAGSLNKTNVWRLYHALDLTTDEQVALYDDGVGTSQSRPLALIGEGFGFGLKKNVRDLYAFLSRNYKAHEYRTEEDKPKIVAFGFSRGAYTIRLLIGLVSNQGLVDSEQREDEFQQEVLRRWDAYYKRFPWFGKPRNRTHEELRKLLASGNFDRQDRDRLWNELETREFEKHKAELEKQGRVLPQIEFVGLWDTVGAYGLPIEELQTLIPLATLPDRRLSPIVKCAYHALSLDDERRSFHPILWDERGIYGTDRIRQVWFPGVHANVGGGYPKDGLAYVTLQWMLRKAGSLGLQFVNIPAEETNEQVNDDDRLYDSRAGFAGYYRYSPRPVSTLCDDPFHGVKIDRPKVHASTFRRIRGGHVKYGPIGIPLDNDFVLEDDAVVEGAWKMVKDANGELTPVRTGSDGVPELEDPDRALQRATRMEVVWNIVWWRRVVYYLTLISSLFLLALPWLVGQWSVRWLDLQFNLSTMKSLPELTPWFTTYVKPILTAASYAVPAWVSSTWFVTFGEEPVLFLAGLLGVIITMALGWGLDRTIHARASDIWHYQKVTAGLPKWVEAPMSTVLYKVRSAGITKTIYRAYRGFFARILVLAAIALGIYWLWKTYPAYLKVYGIAAVVLFVLYRIWHAYRLVPKRSRSV